MTRITPSYGVPALFLLWAGLLFGGFAFGGTDASGARQIPVAAKMASSFVLVVAAWSGYYRDRASRSRRYALFIAIGMSFGFSGDLFMAGLIPVGNNMLGGMASFGIGHIAYLAGMIFLARDAGQPTPLPWRPAWCTWLVVGLACWYVVVFRNANGSPLAGPALGYVLLLASTAGCASELGLRARAMVPLAIGAALFFVSDLFIALGQFAGIHSAALESAIWLTYGPAQMLIVASTLFARGMLEPSSPTIAQPVQVETGR